MNLERAMNVGLIRDDVKEFAALSLILAGMATYRGIGCCACGTPLLLHIEAVWRNLEPNVLRAAISGACCPGCGGALSPSAVTYAGIYSPGWPFVPATVISSADLYHAMALMELENR